MDLAQQFRREFLGGEEEVFAGHSKFPPLQLSADFEFIHDLLAEEAAAWQFQNGFESTRSIRFQLDIQTAFVSWRPTATLFLGLTGETEVGGLGGAGAY